MRLERVTDVDSRRTSDGPEEVRVRVGARLDDLARRENEGDLKDVVDDQTHRTLEMTDA